MAPASTRFQIWSLLSCWHPSLPRQPGTDSPGWSQSSQALALWICLLPFFGHDGPLSLGEAKGAQMGTEGGVKRNEVLQKRRVREAPASHQ